MALQCCDECMADLGIEVSRAGYAYSVEDALAIAEELGYPVVLRPEAEYQPSAMPARTSSPRIPGRVRWAWASGAKARPRASDSSNANRFMLFDL